MKGTLHKIQKHSIKEMLIMMSKRALDKYFIWLPDELYLRIKFYLNMGYRLNLKNPKNFNEKLQWLKLHNRKPEHTSLVDKYSVKEFVARTIGSEYIIPTLGVWNSPDDIEWNKLPMKFVLKTTHGGGNCGVVICKDKLSFDCEKAKAVLRESLKQDIYKFCREYPYKLVNRRIIAEQYIEPVAGTDDLPDYKFFCFDGEVKAMFIGTERQKGEVKFDFFDADFNHLPIKQGHQNAAIPPSKPKNFELMKKIAEKLSKGKPHVRVDLYEVGEKVYFGEMTFFHFSGMMPFQPSEWDLKFGGLLTLPQI